MSIQFGKWTFDAAGIDQLYIDSVVPIILPYAPDGVGRYAADNIVLLHGSFLITQESLKEKQPFVHRSGLVLTWDGRLDNREELISELGASLTHNAPDVVIAGEAFDHWGEDALGRLIGDWAVSIWNPREKRLLLAKDFLGNRPLYYRFEAGSVTWCTVLDPLVLCSASPFSLDEGYIAGWLSTAPATDLSPYSEIAALPAASLVRIQSGGIQIRKYWDFPRAPMIRFSCDHDYEEQFLGLLRQSVKRRLRSSFPVLAELSGGMDSSSIVCVADAILATGNGGTSRLDTVSYYNPSEPNWNELPYFTQVEQLRGRGGTHINVEGQYRFSLEPDDRRFTPLPGSMHKLDAFASEFVNCLASNRNRVVLSGIGGDEVLGGVPAPLPEFANLLASFRVGALFSQLTKWALVKRKPAFSLLLETLRLFFVPRDTSEANPPCWLTSAFIEQNLPAFQCPHHRLKPFRPPPSFQLNLRTMELLRRQIALNSPQPEIPCEWTYPYLDRDLLQFLFAIPPEQILRPGHRRSLMKRALAGIVPQDILERKRKAFVERDPALGARSVATKLLSEIANMSLVHLGIVSAARLTTVLESAQSGNPVPLHPLVRLLALEHWVRGTEAHRTQPQSPSKARDPAQVPRLERMCDERR